MHYIWPKIISSIENRKKKILNTMHKIEVTKDEIRVLHQKAKKIILNSQKKSIEILSDAKKNKMYILENAKLLAYKEREQILFIAHQEIKRKKIQIKNELLKEINNISILMAQKIINDFIQNKRYDVEKLIQDI
ncbi:F0F1 ATP synthase subunit B [Buchnera aphidicola (Shivaphis celti)]